MIAPLPLALMLALAAIGTIHLAWGLGLRWPGKDRETLALFVIGTKRRALLGPFAWTLLATAFFCGTGIAWLGQRSIANHFGALAVYGGYLVLILVFALRGISPYTTAVFSYARGTLFYRLNRKLYAPICLALTAGLIADFPPGIGRFVLSAIS